MNEQNNAWLVLPTFNEAQNIRLVLNKVAAVRPHINHYKLHIVVVDGKSPDGTHEIVQAVIQEGFKNLHLVIEPRRGLGRAYDTGFEYARSNGADVLIEMDSDMSHDPAELPKLLRKIHEGADLVIGSRYVHGGFIPGDWPIKRVINSKVARYVARKVGAVSTAVADPTAGFRAIRASALEEINFVASGATGYVIQVKMVDDFAVNGYTIEEVPIAFADRQFGESKIRFKDIRQFFAFCFKLRISKITTSTRKFRKDIGATIAETEPQEGSEEL